MSRLKDRYNILCLSGGGFRGLYSASLLRQIEQGYGVTDIAGRFDLVIGTSTGALIAAGLAMGHSAKRLEQAFLEHGPAIFAKLGWLSRLNRRLRFRPQYRTGPLSAAIEAVLGKAKAEAQLDQLDANLAIVAVSQINWQLRVLSARPFAEASSRITLADAILASTAAPTYFKAHKIAGVDHLIDGGLVANSPALVGAALLSKRRFVPLDRMFILHVGTASPPVQNSFKTGRKLAYEHYQDLVLTMLHSQDALAGDLCEAVFPQRYLKLDPPAELGVNDELRAMDNAEPEVAGKLQFLAEKTWLEASRSTLLRSFF